MMLRKSKCEKEMMIMVYMAEEFVLLMGARDMMGGGMRCGIGGVGLEMRFGVLGGCV